MSKKLFSNEIDNQIMNQKVLKTCRSQKWHTLQTFNCLGFNSKRLFTLNLHTTPLTSILGLVNTALAFFSSPGHGLYRIYLRLLDY